MLKSSIRTLVREAYKVRGAKYLVIGRLNRAHWSVTTCMNVDKSKLINWMEYLIDNVYIKVGNKVYCQTVGVPVGTDCAPQLPNLFLFHYEYLYMKKLMKDNMCVAKMFSDTVRYIDDLLTLNNATFDAIIGEIYPKELSLKKSSEAANRVLYLDILISICGNKYVTEVYDKRDNFSFEIINFPFMSSRICDTFELGISYLQED